MADVEAGVVFAAAVVALAALPDDAPKPAPAAPAAAFTPTDGCVPGTFKVPAPDAPGTPTPCGRFACDDGTKPGVCTVTPGVMEGVASDTVDERGALDAISTLVSEVAPGGVSVAKPLFASALANCVSASSCITRGAEVGAVLLAALTQPVSADVTEFCVPTWPRSPMPDSAPSATVADEAAWAVSLAALAVLANNAPAVAATDASSAASGKADWVCVSRPSEDAPSGAASRLMGAPACANDNDAGVFASEGVPAWVCPATLKCSPPASLADDAGWVASPLCRVALTAAADAVVAAAATKAEVSPCPK